MYKSVIVVLCSLFLLQSCVQSMSLLGKRRCLCHGRGANYVDLNLINRLEVFPPSAMCEKMEVVVKFKNGKSPTCLNPDSKLVNTLIEFAKKKGNRNSKVK